MRASILSSALIPSVVLMAHAATAQVVQTSATVPVATPSESPGGAELLSNAKVHAAAKRWADAKAAATEAVRVDPANSHVYYLFRSQVHRLEGDYEESVRDAEMVMALRPQVAEAYLMRAMVWMKRSQHQAAINDLTRVLERSPDMTAAYVMRGNAYRALHEDERALADFSAALLRNPKEAVLLWHRGNALWHLGRHAAARDDFEAALALEPSNGRILLSAASFYATCKDDACRDAAKAFDCAKRAGEATGWADWSPLAALGDAYAEAGDFANAGGMIAKALAQAPQPEHSWLQERAALFQAGKQFRTPTH